jgi:hypothetical protein
VRVFPGDRRARREIRTSVEVGTPLTHPRPDPLRDRPNPADKKDDLVNANSDALKKTVARANPIFENGARAPGGVPRAPRPPGLPRATERTGPTHTRPHPPRASRAPSRARLPEGLRINPIVLPRPPRTRAQS